MGPFKWEKCAKVFSSFNYLQVKYILKGLERNTSITEMPTYKGLWTFRKFWNRNCLGQLRLPRSSGAGLQTPPHCALPRRALPSLWKGTDPILRAPPPNTITLGAGALAYAFGGNAVQAELRTIPKHLSLLSSSYNWNTSWPQEGAFEYKVTWNAQITKTEPFLPACGILVPLQVLSPLGSASLRFRTLVTTARPPLRRLPCQAPHLLWCLSLDPQGTLWWKVCMWGAQSDPLCGMWLLRAVQALTCPKIARFPKCIWT